jgi:hypothetical protein
MCPKCGIYMPSKFWDRKGAPATATKLRYYCGVEWAEMRRELPSVVRELEVQYGSLKDAYWAIFCGCKYRPWANGESMVLELRASDGTWYTVISEFMPTLLSDELQKYQKQFVAGCEKLTPEELYAVLPVVLPRANPLPVPVPGIGKVDLVKYRAEGRPVMSDRNWWLFAQAVALKDMAGLKEIFDSASQALAV